MSGPGSHKHAEQRGRILVVFAATPICALADAIAARLRRHGYQVELGDASTGGMPPPEDYDAVVLGSLGPHSRSIARYIEHNRIGLAEVPTAMFTRGTWRDCDTFLRSTGWRPNFTAAFAGDRSDLDRFADALAVGLADAAVTHERTEPHVVH
jgi:menaquinone-dependent protoporphyrinogen IX oxidase